jgi:hypothetical protein
MIVGVDPSQRLEVAADAEGALAIIGMIARRGAGSPA